jgi:predicted metal-binding membrane protein
MTEITTEIGSPAQADRSLPHLRPAEASLAGLFVVPRRPALWVFAVLVLLGWIWLAFGVAGHLAQGHGLGPGLGWLSGAANADVLGRAIWDTLCRPWLGEPAATGQSLFVSAALTLAMWLAMVLAMMLPTAGPMILTYAEIADTAAAKAEHVVSPLVLGAGYLIVWFVAAVVLTVLQLGLTRVGLLGPDMAATSFAVSGAIFLLAGAWQFSRLKQACLTVCQRPFPYFFARWTTAPRGVFALGLRQGLFCLGCCWAMMLVMFAVGTMNVLWMVLVGLAMTAEKLSTTSRLSTVFGVAMLAAGAVMLGMAMRV